MDVVVGEGLGEQLAHAIHTLTLSLLGEQLVHAIHTLNNTNIVVLPTFLRKVDMRLLEKRNSNSHGARPVY